MAETRDPLVGTMFGGRWLVEKPLSSGGMGSVYVARHRESGRHVALKVIRGLDGGVTFAVRFRREIEALAAVTHPNVVKFLDSGAHDDGSLFLVMELLQGRPLRTVMDAGKVPWAKALRVAGDVCRALAAVHKAGIVHRDLKPENIFLQSVEGHADFATLIDFGIVRLASSGEGDGGRPLTTRTGVLVGTPGYISPEQLQGQPATSSSDLYALGVIMYEMVTALAPFAAPNVQAMLVKQLFSPVPMPSSLAPELPPPVDAFILSLMARDPIARPGSAHEALDRLQRVLGEITVDGADELQEERTSVDVGAQLHPSTLEGVFPQSDISSNTPTPPQKLASPAPPPAAAGGASGVGGGAPLVAQRGNGNTAMRLAAPGLDDVDATVKSPFAPAFDGVVRDDRSGSVPSRSDDDDDDDDDEPPTLRRERLRSGAVSDIEGAAPSPVAPRPEDDPPSLPRIKPLKQPAQRLLTDPLADVTAPAPAAPVDDPTKPAQALPVHPAEPVVAPGAPSKSMLAPSPSSTTTRSAPAAPAPAPGAAVPLPAGAGAPRSPIFTAVVAATSLAAGAGIALVVIALVSLGARPPASAPMTTSTAAATAAPPAPLAPPAAPTTTAPSPVSDVSDVSEPATAAATATTSSTVSASKPAPESAPRAAPAAAARTVSTAAVTTATTAPAPPPSEAEVLEFVQARADQLTACEGDRVPRLAVFRVLPTGKVEATSTTQDRASRCLTRTAAGWRMPRFDGTASITVSTRVVLGR